MRFQSAPGNSIGVNGNLVNTLGGRFTGVLNNYKKKPINTPYESAKLA